MIDLASHLDIGCSMGILLERFEKEYHCHPVGIEPGEAHRNHARQAGLTVYASLEELEQNEHARFSLISMAHVLEHLPDPVGYLVHLRETLLDPAGWLLLEVPNLYAHDSFETAHLVAYSAHTLQQTLGKAGFEVVRLEKHGQAAFGLAAALYHLAGTSEEWNAMDIPFASRTTVWRPNVNSGCSAAICSSGYSLDGHGIKKNSLSPESVDGILESPGSSFMNP